MRTTAEVIEAARLGDPCTEEELRLCIVSMRASMLLAHIDHARWASDKTLPLKVRSLANAYWHSINDGWHVPLDVRISPEDWPGHPSLQHRRDVANAVYNTARKIAADKEQKQPEEDRTNGD